MATPAPHDSLFKRIFSRRENAIAELRSLLPTELLAKLDLDKLAVEDRSFIDPELVGRHTDQLYSVPIAGRPGFVYVLFEHKSRAERWTALWLLAYMVRIWEAFLEEHPRAAEMPPIVPLVLHHGETRWRAATAMHELFAPELMAAPALAALTPSFRFLLDDIAGVSDEELRARQMSTFARLGLWALRDGRSERLLRTLVAFLDCFEDLLRTEVGRLDAQAVLQYIYIVQGEATYETLVDAIPSQRVRETAMTIAEQLRQEGLQEGLQEGELRGRRALLRRQLEAKFGKLGPQLLERLDAAGAEALDRLAERVLSASSLEELFGD
jgi:predicted transposase YdaD